MESLKFEIQRYMKSVIKSNDKQTFLLVMPDSLTKNGLCIRLTKKESTEILALVELCKSPLLSIKTVKKQLTASGLTLAEQLSDADFVYYLLKEKTVRYKPQKTLFEPQTVELKLNLFND